MAIVYSDEDEMTRKRSLINVHWDMCASTIAVSNIARLFVDAVIVSYVSDPVVDGTIFTDGTIDVRVGRW